MSSLSREEVLRIARLSRLELTETQAEQYRAQLGAILHYMGRLRAVDLAGVEPMTTPLDMGPRLADDIPGPTLPTDALMRMAPAATPPFIQVPKVLGEGTGA